MKSIKWLVLAQLVVALSIMAISPAKAGNEAGNNAINDNNTPQNRPRYNPDGGILTLTDIEIMSEDGNPLHSKYVKEVSLKYVGYGIFVLEEYR